MWLRRSHTPLWSHQYILQPPELGIHAAGGSRPGTPPGNKAAAKMANYITLLEAKMSTEGALAVRDALAADHASSIADLSFEAASQLIDRLMGIAVDP